MKFRTLMKLKKKIADKTFQPISSDKSIEYKPILNENLIEDDKIIMPIVERIEASVNDDVKYIDYLPLYSLKAACGKFSEWQTVEEEGWVKVEDVGKLNNSMYVVRAIGNSMLPKIKDGDLCVFRANVVGSRQNKIVLVQHNDVYDSENEGSFSIKKYSSEKVIDKITGEWKHEQIILKPENFEYENIIIQNDDGFMVVGEFIGLV